VTVWRWKGGKDQENFTEMSEQDKRKNKSSQRTEEERGGEVREGNGHLGVGGGGWRGWWGGEAEGMGLKVR
jgi:hypothetical protein